MLPFSPGPAELLVVGVIALLLFGKRLPEVARNLGKGFSEFKKGVSGFQDEVKTATHDVDRNIDYSSTPEPPKSEASEVEDDFSSPKFLDD